MTDIRTVTISARDDHDGRAAVTVSVPRQCPRRGAARGPIRPAATSFDGSRRLRCDRWSNPRGHLDTYAAARAEAAAVRTGDL